MTINAPIVDIFGSGDGSKNADNIRPNSTAVIKVTGIDNNGTIKSVIDGGITITDPGENYRGAIGSLIRPRNFEEDQLVYNSSRTGSGRVEYYDASINQLILYDVVGFFTPNDELISDTGEKPRAFITKSYTTPVLSRNGFEVVNEVQNIEFPSEYTFKTSNSEFKTKKIVKLELLDGYSFKNNVVPKIVSFTQDIDKIFGVPGLTIGVDKLNVINDKVFSIDVSNVDYLDKIYVSPSTKIAKDISGISSASSFVLTIDDASRFPITNGIIKIGNHEIKYKNRSLNQLFHCTTTESTAFNLYFGDDVISAGREKYDVDDYSWSSGLEVKTGEYKVHNNNIYQALSDGITGSIAPSHLDGIEVDGVYVTDINPVRWKFIRSNRLDHLFYIDYNDTSVTNPVFRVLALPGETVIENNAPLYRPGIFKIAKFDDPNVKFYNFADSDVSDRLASLVYNNFNRSRSVVDSVYLPSNKSLIGYSTSYDFGNYIYSAGTAIPSWWNDIVDISSQPSTEDAKKIAFTNQKLIVRWSKDAPVTTTQAFGLKTKTRKSIGTSLDAVQFNCYKGNTVNYGKINKFIISKGGNYTVPLKLESGKYIFDVDKYPRLKIQKPNNKNNFTFYNNNSNRFLIAASVDAINFTNLVEAWPLDGGNGNLEGFTQRPKVEVINNNERIYLTLNKNNISGSTIESTGHGLKTTDKVIFRIDGDYFDKLTNTFEYIVRRVDNNKFKLFYTESDCLFDRNAIDLTNNLSNNSQTFTFETERKNPPNFRAASIDVSFNYKTKTIDNLIITDKGFGYIVAPTIKITDGGKQDLEIPFQTGNKEIVSFKGSIVSSSNYYKETDNNIVATDTSITSEWSYTPTAFFDIGSGAEGVVYTQSGKIVSALVLKKGSGYRVAPEIVVTGPGKDASLKAIINSSGKIVDIEIINGGSGYDKTTNIEFKVEENDGDVSVSLNEWTFNMASQLSRNDRIDKYGGYVFDSGDIIPTNYNQEKFKVLDYELNFPKDLDTKQYLTIKPTKKFIATFLKKRYAGKVPGIETMTDDQVINIPTIHGSPVGVSYDGVPIYCGNGLKLSTEAVITDPTESGFATQYHKMKSRYKLKYSTSQPTTTNRLSITVSGTQYWVSRDGGPDINDYPIGSFIEDYEYVKRENSYTDGDGILIQPQHDLDEHNGRFTITPEFPNGKYCYFVTLESFDNVTNAIITDSSVYGESDPDIGNWNGFPYVIGDKFASTVDEYMNTKCRTSDRIPSVFNRIFEKDISGIPGKFDAIPANKVYPQENDNLTQTIASYDTSRGSVENVIVEYAGDDYKIGDKLIVDDRRTKGSGFSGFVSLLSGRKITTAVKDVDSDYKKVTFITDKSHGMTVGDRIKLDYDKPIGGSNVIYLKGNPLFTDNTNAFTTNSLVDVTAQSDDDGNFDDYFNDKELLILNVNKSSIYEFRLPTNSEHILSYDIYKRNKFFTLEDNPADAIIVNTTKIPNLLYLHIKPPVAIDGVKEFIYEIRKQPEFVGSYLVSEVTDTTFVVNFKESTQSFLTNNLFYDVKSFSAKGPIKEVSVGSGGTNYEILPSITKIVKKGTQDELAGDGKAILQANSTNIGRIQNVAYSSECESVTENKNVKHYFNVPSTAKIINNFEIYDVEILSAGKDYESTDKILVDGKSNLASFKINLILGSISSIEVIDPGYNFSTTPTLTIQSSTGSGATLNAKIRRKPLLAGDVLTSPPNSILYPINLKSNIVEYDVNNSTIIYDSVDGYFKENDIVYFKGNPYGKIVNISQSKIYAKTDSHVTFKSEKNSISGNTSEYFQKITDSDYYQDWSYSIKSTRNTTEWRTDQKVNTHPAGFKPFGKKLIERRKSFFKDPNYIFKSSTIFTTKLTDLIKLKVKISPCGKKKIFIDNTTGFDVGSFIYGMTSTAVGRIIEKTDSYIEIELYGSLHFILNEPIFVIQPEYAFGISDATDKSVAFCNGIMQKPGIDYDIAEDGIYQTGLPDKFIPKFLPELTDEIVFHKTTTEFDVLDVRKMLSTDNFLFLSKNNTTVAIDDTTKYNFIISIAGVVQNPDNFNVTNNKINLGTTVNYDSTIFSVKHDQLSKLTFSATGNTFNITSGQTIDDTCQLLIFRDGIFQSAELGDYSRSGNQITFLDSATVNATEIFGWHINETVVCDQVDISTLYGSRIRKLVSCANPVLRQKIESNVVKSPRSLYEIRSKQLSGTSRHASNTVVWGYDTEYTYTTPRESSSYVEVLDPITFNGSDTSFTIKRLGKNYSPVNGEESIVVNIKDQSGDRIILDHDTYSVSGSTITFTTAHPSTSKCTIFDYISDYSSNTNGENGCIIDRLNVVQNGTRTTFNLSDRGVPKYTRNVGDVFAIKNNTLLRPDSVSQSITDNKITFTTAPTSSDNINLVYFNRQLLPVSTNNVLFDDLYCFDGVRTSFPFAIDGAVKNYTSTANLHLYIVRNGVMQKPGIDYVLAENSSTGTWQVNFSEAPTAEETGKIFGFFSYGGNLTRNYRLNIANYIDGTNTKFSLTRNYQALAIWEAHHVLLFRNGVHQEYTTNYTISTEPSSPWIDFVTAPQTTDELFMINVVNESLLLKSTSNINQVNSSTLSASFSNLTSSNFIIFVDGIKQNPNSAYTVTPPTGNSSLYTFNFTSNVSLSTNNVSIYAYNGSAPTMFNQCDEITVTNTSTLTYNITSGGSAVTPYTDSGILVAIDGVVQEYGVAYTTSGSTITFTANAVFELGDKIDMITIGGAQNEVDFIDDNYNKSTETTSFGTVIKPNRYKLTFIDLSDSSDIYQVYNPSVGFDPDDIMIIRNGVVQNPTEDYTIGHGYIEFTTNVAESEDLYLLYVHSRDELTFTQTGSTSNTKTYTLTNTLTSIGASEDDIIVYADGAPRFKRRGDFTVTNDNTITLTHTDGFAPNDVFIIRYPTLLLLDPFDNCPDGSRTIFNLYQNENNWIVGEVTEDADVLISKNGIVLSPGVEYNLISSNRQVEFTTAPLHTDVIFFIKMNGNDLKTLTPVSGNTYNLADNYPTDYDKEGLVIFSNNKWNFAESGEFTWNDNNTITLSTAHTTGELFAIKFFGVFNLLDDIHTPFNGSISKFNLFDGEENFVPPGTISDDSTPHETGILVFKNDTFLNPGVDYTLTGDIKSQINFTTNPTSSDVISVRSLGSFKKLDTITAASTTKNFNLTYSGNSYYPDAHINRPRDFENQIMVIVDDVVYSPLYDYFIEHNKLRFVSNVASGSEIVLLDFQGAPSDVEVFRRFNEVSVGDNIMLDGDTEYRVVSEVVSPTVLRTQSYTGDRPESFSASSTISGGEVTSITVNNDGNGFDGTVVVKTSGTGVGAMFKGNIDYSTSGIGSTEVIYPGNNVYNNHNVYATVAANVYKEQPINKPVVRKATKLASNINSTATSIPLANVANMVSNTPSVSISSSSGSAATFRPVVSDGQIVSVEILTPGSGYDDRDAVLSVTGGGGSGCVLELTLDISGSVTGVTVQNGGIGYDSNTVNIYYEDSGNVKYETIEYTDINTTSNTLLGCTRGANNTTPKSHVVGTSPNFTLVYFDI